MENNDEMVADSENEEEMEMNAQFQDPKQSTSAAMDWEDGRHSGKYIPPKVYDREYVNEDAIRPSLDRSAYMTSHISTFATEDVRPGPSKGVSSISQFTSPDRSEALGGKAFSFDPLSSIAIPSIKAPRPKPRPVPPKRKHIPTDTPIETSDISSYSFMDHVVNKAISDTYAGTLGPDSFAFPQLSSIADRAKTRQRKAAPSVTKDVDGMDAVDTESREEHPNRNSKAKTKAAANKAKTKSAKGKERAAEGAMSNEIIELTDDDDDELNLKVSRTSSARGTSDVPLSGPTSISGPVNQHAKLPRPRPRPVPRKVKPPSDNIAEELRTRDPISTPPHPPPETDLSSSHPRIDHPLRNSAIPSSLPPSDFTLPPSLPGTNVYDLPPIEILPNANAPSELSDDAGFLSSGAQKFRSEIDELFSGDDDDFNVDVPTRAVDPKMGAPPPTFFAGSSSLPKEAVDDDIARAAGLGETEVVDLTMFPTMPQQRLGVTVVQKPLKPSATKRKQKTTAEDDDGWDPIRGDVDGNKKAKATKNGAKVFRQVEVVITTVPPLMHEEKVGRQAAEEVAVANKKGKRKVAKVDTKGKGKARDKGAVKGKGKEKEVFKSSEFVQDSDEDPLLQSLASPSSVVVVEKMKNPPSTQSTSSGVNHRLPPSTPVREYSLEPLSPLPPDMDTDMEYGDAEVLKQARGKEGKKRKSRVVLDEDEYGEIEEHVESPNKKRKKSTGKEKKVREKKGGKSKAIPSHDGGDRETEVADLKPPGTVEVVETKESTRNDPMAKKTTLVSGDEQHQDELDDDQKPTRDIVSVKENIEPAVAKPGLAEQQVRSDISTPKSQYPPLHKRYFIAPRTKPTPMTELIKRVNSLPSSPFPPASASRISSLASRATAYSPYLKSSRSLLSKIAPLHPNRRTPPPPLPPPPPRKKTKKELEREEKWEDELVESVGGIETWAAMGDAERKELRRAKIEREMGGWDD